MSGATRIGDPPTPAGERPEKYLIGVTDPPTPMLSRGLNNLTGVALVMITTHKLGTGESSRGVKTL